MTGRALITPNQNGAMGRLIHFPMRRANCIWIIAEAEDAPWLVVAGDHGWARGEKESAEADARWLAANFNLPIRSASA